MFNAHFCEELVVYHFETFQRRLVLQVEDAVVWDEFFLDLVRVHGLDRLAEEAADERDDLVALEDGLQLGVLRVEHLEHLEARERGAPAPQERERVELDGRLEQVQPFYGALLGNCGGGVRFHRLLQAVERLELLQRGEVLRERVQVRDAGERQRTREREAGQVRIRPHGPRNDLGPTQLHLGHEGKIDQHVQVIR